MTSRTHLYTPSADEIASVVESMTVTYPGENARIERAAQLLAQGAVDYAEGAGFTVDSQRDSRPQDPEDPEPIRYLVTSGNCQCKDFENRNHHDEFTAPCKHIFAVKGLIRIVGAALDTAIKQPMSGVYAIECRTPDLFAVYDLASDITICGCTYSRISDTYRPEVATDAAAFARWLKAQPLEYYAGGALERILRTAPGSTVTLKATVIYGSPRQYTLVGWRNEGDTWRELEYAERQPVTETAWANTLAASGWIMPGRPVKQSGLSYNYMLERGDNGQEHYGLAAGTEEYRTNERMGRQFENEMDGGFA